MTTVCGGLPGNWLNAWLAAVGVTVAVPGARLSWTDDEAPVAVLTASGDVAQAITEMLPVPSEVPELGKALAYAEGTPRNQTNSLTLAEFRRRAVIERSVRSDILSASTTDCAGSKVGDAIDKSAFEPAAPGSAGNVLYRLSHSLAFLPQERNERREWVEATLTGEGRRVPSNGLGFDCTRLPTGADPLDDNRVDPVVEFLAFRALALFPVRGNGVRALTRGWHGGKTARDSFQWPTWTASLDRWAIDALLDRFDSLRSKRPWRLRNQQLRVLSISQVYGVVPYQTSGSDATRAYFSERLR